MATASAPGPVPRPRACGAEGRRHCWVALDDVDPMPGVAAGWRHTKAGTWEARVSYLLDDQTGGVVTGWLPASMLRPHHTTATAMG